MSGLTVQVVGYQIPTVLPAPAGVCPAMTGAPVPHLADTDPYARAQRLLNVMTWARTTLRPSSKGLKVFVAPEAYFRRFVPSPHAAGTFDPNAGLGHYAPDTPERILAALTAALSSTPDWDDWLLVCGCEAWADATHTTVASDLLIVAPAQTSPRGILLREIVRPGSEQPYTLQQALQGDLPRATVVRPRFALSSFLAIDGGLLAFESTLGHNEGQLRRSLQGLSAALGTEPNPGLQVLCSIDRDLDPSEVIASPQGLAAISDGMLARDPNDAIALGTPPRFALAEVSAYNDSIAQLTEQRPASITAVPDALQLQIPVPAYTAKQSVSLYKPMPLPRPS